MQEDAPCREVPLPCLQWGSRSTLFSSHLPQFAQTPWFCPNPVVLVPGRCAEQAGVPQEAQCASGNHGGTGVPRHRDLQPGHIGDIFWVALLVVGSAERCRAGPGWCYGAGHVSLGTNSPRGSRWDPVAITHPLPGEERAVPAHHSPCSPQINYPARKKNEFLD